VRFRHPLFEQAEKTLDFFLLVQAPEADAIGVLGRDHQTRIVPEESEVVVRIARAHDGGFADLLDDGDAVVRIYEFFPDFETQFCCWQRELLSDH
jgi:hypothetical protein